MIGGLLRSYLYNMDVSCEIVCFYNRNQGMSWKMKQALTLEEKVECLWFAVCDKLFRRQVRVEVLPVVAWGPTE